MRVAGLARLPSRQDCQREPIMDPLERDENITARQCLAARSLLGWSQARLADLAGVPLRSLRAFEELVALPLEKELVALRVALEVGGIVFTAGAHGNEGVRLRRSDEPARPPNVTLH